MPTIDIIYKGEIIKGSRYFMNGNIPPPNLCPLKIMSAWRPWKQYIIVYENAWKSRYTNIYIYLILFSLPTVCVCVCVCVKERELSNLNSYNSFLRQTNTNLLFTLHEISQMDYKSCISYKNGEPVVTSLLVSAYGGFWSLTDTVIVMRRDVWRFLKKCQCVFWRKITAYWFGITLGWVIMPDFFNRLRLWWLEHGGPRQGQTRQKKRHFHETLNKWDLTHKRHWWPINSALACFQTEAALLLIHG